LAEATELREAGISGRMVLLGPELLECTEELVRLSVEIVVDCSERLESVLRAGRILSTTPSVHLAVNTGMGRFGSSLAEAEGLAAYLSSDPRVHWAGVMTHFASADTDVERTREQWNQFRSLIARWTSTGIKVPCCHAANSAAIMTLPETHAQMVRPGIMLYGAPPCDTPTSSALLPVLRWSARVVALHWREAGEYIGYGGTFCTSRRTRVATLAAGYGDGVPRAAANRAWVLVAGGRAPVIGRISMDQTTLDVTDLPRVELGMEAVLIGQHGPNVITADDWGGWCDTISYEITTRLDSRVPYAKFID
jgi:alanine racemase